MFTSMPRLARISLRTWAASPPSTAARSQPTAWEEEVHTGPIPLSRLVAERPGNVVVLSGRNRGKIDAILAALGAGLHVLADKPWVIDVADLPKLARPSIWPVRKAWWRWTS